jgi:hypothetical protein
LEICNSIFLKGKELFQKVFFSQFCYLYEKENSTTMAIKTMQWILKKKNVPDEDNYFYQFRDLSVSIEQQLKLYKHFFGEK